MPSATAFLGFEKSVRDFLGGWSAQARERTVVAQLQKGLSDPLAEAEILAQLDDFLPLRVRSAGGGTESVWHVARTWGTN